MSDVTVATGVPHVPSRRRWRRRLSRYRARAPPLPPSRNLPLPPRACSPHVLSESADPRGFPSGRPAAFGRRTQHAGRRGRCSNSSASTAGRRSAEGAPAIPLPCETRGAISSSAGREKARGRSFREAATTSEKRTRPRRETISRPRASSCLSPPRPALPCGRRQGKERERGRRGEREAAAPNALRGLEAPGCPQRNRRRL
jgi:hypothetical protein